MCLVAANVGAVYFFLLRTSGPLDTTTLRLRRTPIGIHSSRVLCPARHITGHFRDESLQAITCTDIDNSTQTGQKPKSQNKQTGPR